MTDKVQKILNEITVRKLCTMDEHMAFYNDTAKEDYRFLSEIEELVKALQEEPVSDEQPSVILYGLTGSVGNTKEEPQVKESAEIERDKETCKEKGNSLTQESVSEDLEEAANDAVISLVPSFGQKYSDGSYVSCIRDCFKREELIKLYKAGAAWKNEQMMAKAVDGEVGYWNLRGLSINTDLPHSVSEGDKVKIIVINDD